MMTIELAANLYIARYPHHIIETIIDVEDEWVFSVLDAETRQPLDSSPISINKQTGEFRVFFPPANMHKMKTAKYIRWEK